MKNQASFSSKDKSKQLKCRLLQFLFGALRVNCCVLVNIPRVSKIQQYNTTCYKTCSQDETNHNIMFCSLQL